jgi:hypothetical protein
MPVRFKAAQAATPDFRPLVHWCYPADIRLGVMASFSHAMMIWEAAYVAA